jgi:predicted DNA-binding protein
MEQEELRNNGEAKIKKEYLITNIEKKDEIKIGEKRKLITTEGKRKKNKNESEEKSTPKPHQHGEINEMSMETVKLLCKSQYSFKYHDQVLKRVTNYSEEHNKFKNNIVKQLNHEKFPDMEDFDFKPTNIKSVDFKGKSILAPLTTVGNLPFRRICKDFGVDITVGEMALATNILKGKKGELSLLRRHECEDVFGIQVAGSNASDMIKLAEFIRNELKVDFVDINCGCPIDTIFNKGILNVLKLRVWNWINGKTIQIIECC